jgi:acetyl esterase/lipase
MCNLKTLISIKIFLPFILIAVSDILFAQSKEIRLFEGLAPNEKVQEKETLLIEQLTHISVVSNPTIEYFIPTQSKMDGAVIVCPGGGYSRLAYEKEGLEICRKLNDMGIIAVLLKYRVPRREGQEKYLAPLQDLQRAIRHVRFHAAEYKISVNKIGVMGFSAGGHLSVMASTAYKTSSYLPIDKMDSVSAKPNFTILVYPAYLSWTNFQISPEIKVDKDVSPTLIIHAANDTTYIRSSLFYYYALINAQVNAEIHIYANGGHGFGLRSTDPQCKLWPNRLEEWLKTILK